MIWLWLGGGGSGHCESEVKVAVVEVFGFWGSNKYLDDVDGCGVEVK